MKALINTIGANADKIFKIANTFIHKTLLPTSENINFLLDFTDVEQSIGVSVCSILKSQQYRAPCRLALVCLIIASLEAAFFGVCCVYVMSSSSLLGVISIRFIPKRWQSE